MTRAFVIAIILFAAFAALPYVVEDYYVGLTTKMLIFALFAMSLDLMLGYAGLASLGHAAFFGLGGYAVALLSVRAHVSDWISFPAGLLAATLGGILFALLGLRARGSYFVMITLALSQTVWGIAFGWRTLTGGDDGLPGVHRPTFFMSFSGQDEFYYFVLGCVGVSALALAAIVNSPFGHAIKGIRESETRMQALGFDVWRHQFVAFVMAAFFAGLAGILFVYENRFVNPQALHVTISAEALIMVILGGAGTLFGPAIGAFLIVFLEDAISSATQRWLTILGLIYVATTLFAPRGLVGLWIDLMRRRAR